MVPCPAASASAWQVVRLVEAESNVVIDPLLKQPAYDHTDAPHDWPRADTLTGQGAPRLVLPVTLVPE